MNSLIKALNARNIVAEYCSTSEEARKKIIRLVKDKMPKDIGVFGTVSVRAIGALEELRAQGFSIKDPYYGKIDTEEDRFKIKMDCMDTEMVFMSVNALTEEGIIINVDGLGNRVSTMMVGPKTVILVVGKNKIVKNIDQGIKRIRDIAAPLNVKRLKIETPCYFDKECVRCASPKCICRYTLIMEQQKFKDRMYLFLVGEDLGY